MISKNSLILLLSELQATHNVDTTKQITEVASSTAISMDVLKFINSYRELEICKFYTHLRKSYNQKKSKLYINIMKDITDPTEVLTTLASLHLQILLFSKKVEDKQMFLEHSRAVEISKVLLLYLTKYDLANCIKLLNLIKADIEAFEYVQGRRN
jgi:hypothetical protein